MDQSVRKQKSGDQLTVGDWLAPEALMEGAAEVLFAYAYPASADRSRDNDGKHVQLVVREQGKAEPWSEIVAGSTLFDLASEEDLAELREKAERAQKIADLRTFAGWLEANSWAPMPNYFDASAHLDERHPGGPGVSESYSTVCEVGDRLGLKPEERLGDRTVVRKGFGSLQYQVIAWHSDGRPAVPEPKRGTTCEELSDDESAPEHAEVGGWKGEGPGTCGVECACGVTYDNFDSLAEASELLARHIADPRGMDRSRSDEDADDPAPVSPARVPPHVGAVTNEGLVDESEPACPGCGHPMAQHDEDGCCVACHCHPDCTDLLVSEAR